MMRFGLYILFLGLFLMFNGCQTLKEPHLLTLDQIVEQDEVISLPYKLYRDSVFMVELRSLEGNLLPFIIDTGATKSAIFKRTTSKLSLSENSSSLITVHGLAEFGDRPLVEVPVLFADGVSLNNISMAVLENPAHQSDETFSLAGLIGMDILSNYRVYVNAENKTFNLVPTSLAEPLIPFRWEWVELKTNPYSELDHDLHFLEIRIAGQLVPALIDTGSEINFMTWGAANYAELRQARKRLWEKWVIEGSVGEFEPEFRILTKGFRSGQKFWDKTEFLVSDLDGLAILGFEEQPFLIAGSPLFLDQTFYLDFEKNILRFEDQRGKG